MPMPRSIPMNSCRAGCTRAPRPDNPSWTFLDAHSTGDAGRLHDVSRIRRVNTHGVPTPRTTCLTRGAEMTFITTVDPAEARDEVAAMYRRQQDSWGFV